MNIASHRIPSVPVDASLSAPGDRAGGWKWGLFIFYTDVSISRKAKSSSFCSGCESDATLGGIQWRHRYAKRVKVEGGC